MTGKELIYKRKVISLSRTQPRADRYQQPQMTAICPFPTASAIDRSCLGSLPEDKGLHLPWPECHRDTSVNTNGRHANNDNDSSNDGSSCNLLRVRYGAGIVLNS